MEPQLLRIQRNPERYLKLLLKITRTDKFSHNRPFNEGELTDVYSKYAFQDAR
jgi:hypothetical protein